MAVACRDMGASPTSAFLRPMARRVDEASALLQKGASIQDPRVKAHLADNLRACEKKELRSLARRVDRKAKGLEERDSKDMQKQ